MHIILWEFTVRDERIQDFISAYGSNGDWASLFRRAEGYLGTELLRSSQDPNIFLTIDRWKSAVCFEIFQKRFGTEYKKLDSRFESYTSSEKKVGCSWKRSWPVMNCRVSPKSGPSATEAGR